MVDSIHMPFISRNIQVIDSDDPTLVGVSGQIIEETRRTIIVQTSKGEKILPKNVINFTLDSKKDFQIDRNCNLVKYSDVPKTPL